MLDEIFESERLIFKTFDMLLEEEKSIIVKSWDNPFNARYNAMKNARKSLEEICATPEPTFTNLDDYDDCMYFRVAFSKETGELVGTCRFGKYYKVETADVWDFGFNVLLRHWYAGFGAEIVAKIIEIAKAEGVKKIKGGADIENYGSYKTMIKNGFDFVDYDDDGDYEYVLSLDKKAKTKEEIDLNWENHLEMTKKDLGEEKFARLETINTKILKWFKKLNRAKAKMNSLKNISKS